MTRWPDDGATTRVFARATPPRSGTDPPRCRSRADRWRGRCSDCRGRGGHAASHQETSVGTEVLYGGVENEPLGELERTGTSGVAPRARAGLDATTAGKRLAEQPVRGDGPDDGGDGPGVRSRVRRLRRAAPLVADAPPVPSARARGAV